MKRLTRYTALGVGLLAAFAVPFLIEQAIVYAWLGLFALGVPMEAP